jgi:hypothetical protein
LEERPTISSLSGLSGGPVYWSNEDRYGLVGIVYEANDVSGNVSEDAAFGDIPRIQVYCELVTQERFQGWLANNKPYSKYED